MKQDKVKLNTPIVFVDEITPENIDILITKLSEVLNNTDNNITLYFSTDGGRTVASDIFIHYLSNVDNTRIKIIITESLHSCGFVIFLKLCKLNFNIQILKDTTAIIHLFTYGTHTREILNKDTGIADIIKSVENSNKRFLKKVKKLIPLVLTKKQYNKIKKGKDVCLFYQDLEKIINYYKKK